MARQLTVRSVRFRSEKLRAAASMMFASSTLCGLLATPSWAQTTVETCVNSTTHVVRFAPKPTVTGGGCSKKETEGTIDVTGPAGPQGPPGPPGSANAWSLTGNASTNPSSNFLGTTDSEPLDIEVKGVRAMSYEPAVKNANNDTAPNVIGGDAGNTTGSGVQGATIAGGGGTSGTPSPNPPNSVQADFGTIGGGLENTVTGGLGASQAGLAATIAGGSDNVAGATGAKLSSGFFDGDFPGQVATVGGGAKNEASGIAATVVGGTQNLASGNGATVAGGVFNAAAGDFSFAAGSNAIAAQEGTFVWADASSTSALTSFAPNSFLARAVGGFAFFTGGSPHNNAKACVIDGPGATPEGNLLCTGSVTATAFNMSSDRTMKTGFQPIASSEVLNRVVSLPVSSWTFKGQKVRHIGPMAQDFYAAFKVGTDDKHISITDAQGVALAAIQGLYQELQAKDAEIAKLSARLDKLERETQVARDGAAMHPASALQPARPASVTGF